MSSQYHFENYCLFLFCHSYHKSRGEDVIEISQDAVHGGVLVDWIFQGQSDGTQQNHDHDENL